MKLSRSTTCTSPPHPPTGLCLPWLSQLQPSSCLSECLRLQASGTIQPNVKGHSVMSLLNVAWKKKKKYKVSPGPQAFTSHNPSRGQEVKPIHYSFTSMAVRAAAVKCYICASYTTSAVLQTMLNEWMMSHLCTCVDQSKGELFL